MKMNVFFSAILILCLLCNSCFAQQWRKDRYDTRWLPITDAEMTRQVKSSSHDAVALYRLFDRARYQHRQKSYFATLKQLKQQQPNNGVVLATYCAVIMESNTLYGFGQWKFDLKPQDGTASAIQKELARAEKLEPKLWLIPLVKAELVFVGYADRVKASQQAISLSRKAVALAPNLSFTHEKLGYYLVNLAQEKNSSYSDAVQSYEKAQKLLPVDSDASFLLLNISGANSATNAKAQKAVLAGIPSSVKLTSKQRQFLQKQGVSVPAGR